MSLLSIIPWDLVLGGIGIVAAFFGWRWKIKRDTRRDVELEARREQHKRRDAARKAERDARNEVRRMSDDDVSDELHGDGWGTGR